MSDSSHLTFFGQPLKCEVAYTSFRLAPPKSDMAKSIWRARRGHMAPKPEPARLAYVFGMVLAVAAISLAITTPNLAAPRSPIYHPQLLLLPAEQGSLLIAVLPRPSRQLGWGLFP